MRPMTSIHALPCCLLALALAACSSADPQFAPPQSSKGNAERADAPAEWARFQRERRLPVGAAEIPVDAWQRAAAASARLPLYSTRQHAFVPTSTRDKAAAPRWEFLGPTNVAGRARAFAFDPRNADRLYLAGVSGGLWVSNDAGANWAPLSDAAAYLNIGALAIDPLAPDTIYLGTGELYRYSEQPYASMWGQGILRSRDGGQSFQQLVASSSDDFRYVADIEISAHDHRRLYAATNSGVWRSDDGGSSFQRVLRPADANDGNRYEGCTELQLLPDAQRDVLLAACASRSIDDRYWLPGTILPAACSGPCPAALFRNEDAGGGGAWTQVLSEPGMGRTSIDYARSSPAIVYAVSASIVPGTDRTGDGRGDYDNGLHAVWRSNDAGRTWEARVRNTSTDRLSTFLLSYADSFDATTCGFGANDPYSAGWYNQAIAVNPLNPEVVWVAGMEHYRSDDGGRSFGKASYWWYFGRNAYGVHADQHVLRFDPRYGAGNARLYSLNDGGLAYTLTDAAPTVRGARAACGPTEGMVRWASLTNGMGTTQYYTGTVSADGRTLMGGLQDNGTLLNTSGGSDRNWRHVHGGDGAHVAIDPRDPRVLYASSQNVGLVRSVDGGNTFVGAASGLNDTPIFIMPYLLDPAAPERLYAGATRVWRTDDQGRAWRQASARFGAEFRHRVSALALSPVDPQRMLAGNQVAIHWTTQALSSDASTTWSASSPRAGWVSSLVYDPVAAEVAYATYSSFGGDHVWRSDDAGRSWRALDGEGAGRLPDIPVHSIAIDPTDRQRLYLGTDLGVYVSIDGGAHWAQENTGFANAITESVQVARGDAGNPPRLYAFTYGRGVWSVPLADLDGVAGYSIGADLSGSFYDPAQDGHGWFIEATVIDGVVQVLAAWYTYLDGQPHWLIGVGVAAGDRARIPLTITRGANFPPAFDPAAVTRESWGEVELRFDDRDRGRARWTTSYPGYASGEMPLSRLTHPAAGDGTGATARIAACHAGTWYNPAQDGHGLMLQVVGAPESRQLLAIWYVYQDGAQRWLVGQGPVVGDSATMDLVSTRGATFPPAFNPAQVVREAWGTLRFTAIDGDRARIEWNSVAPGYGAGSMELRRLSSLYGNACNQ